MTYGKYRKSFFYGVTKKICDPICDDLKNQIVGEIAYEANLLKNLLMAQFTNNLQNSPTCLTRGITGFRRLDKRHG
jgi:hypothetical protein